MPLSARQTRLRSMSCQSCSCHCSPCHCPLPAGQMHLRGWGTKVDKGQAVKLWELAARLIDAKVSAIAWCSRALPIV